MAARLILNADDFGLTHGINRAVAELHLAGVLTSATLMANGPAFEEAAAFARHHPALGVGCHIVLVDGLPVSHPADIPTLVGADGKSFRPSLLDFALAATLGHIREADIEREALAQIQKLQRAGLDVTHADTHKHTHAFPAVARPLLRLLSRTSVTSVRNPFEPEWARAASPNTRLRSLLQRQYTRFEHSFHDLPELRSGALKTTAGTIGIAATGQVDAGTLRALLNAVPAEGTWELLCHPGYNDEDLGRQRTRLREHRDVERTALHDVVPELLRNPEAPELIHYGSLGLAGTLRSLGQFQQDTGYERVL